MRFSARASHFGNFFVFTALSCASSDLDVPDLHSPSEHSQDRSPPASQVPEGPANAGDVENGQTGSPGEVDPELLCDTSSQCQDRAETAVAELAAPRSAPTLSEAVCEEGGVMTDTGSASGSMCHCRFDTGTHVIGPVGLGCYVKDRTGDCLFQDGQFSGCDVAESSSCEAACEQLADALADDAARELDVGVESSSCVEDQCVSVLRVESACYYQKYRSGLGYDCSLSPAELLEKTNADSAPQCPPTCAEEPEPEEYFPRDPNEWQGMRIDTSIRIACETSATCGLARACVDDICTACTEDSQCSPGELCALDHCIPADLVECRSYTDCPNGQLCILSGYTGGTARGNEDTRAYCLGASGSSSDSDG